MVVAIGVAPLVSVMMPLPLITPIIGVDVLLLLLIVVGVVVWILEVVGGRRPAPVPPA